MRARQRHLGDALTCGLIRENLQPHSDLGEAPRMRRVSGQQKTKATQSSGFSIFCE